jgi:hypothetical protein
MQELRGWIRPPPHAMDGAIIMMEAAMPRGGQLLAIL